MYPLAAVAGVVGSPLLKLPPMLGYLSVGVVIGPHALGLAADSASVKYLAEFGVVFLMFVIGLEFNLPKLRSMRTLVFGLGLSQVVLTLAGALVGNAVLAWLFITYGSGWDLDWRGAVVLGGAMAMSSTAIVVKLMAERLELESEHGKRVMGVLLFQDLAVVPLLVLIPALGAGLGEGPGDGAGANGLLVSMGWALVKASVVLALLLVGGQKLMRWWLTLVARRKSEELFVLNLLLVTLGPVVAKAVLVTALARAFRAPAGVALRTGLYLAQAGEFGFVLLTLGAEQHLIDPQWVSPVLASMVLSMLATPFLILYSNALVARLVASDWLLQSVQLTSIARKSMRTEAHIIIAGYGRSGQNLARILEREAIPYMALDLDPDRVRQAAAAGQSVVFGDAARIQSLMAAGLARASAVVVSYHDTPSALKILQLVREHAPKVPVLVRTIDDTDLERLRAAGATEVVPEAIEGSLMLASHALALVGVPMRRVIRMTRDARDARYGLLRGYFHGADDDTVEELHQARLLTVGLPPASAVIGQRLGALALHAIGVEVVSVRHAGGAVQRPDEALVLQADDTLVLSGVPEALALAEEKLLKG